MGAQTVTQSYTSMCKEAGLPWRGGTHSAELVGGVAAWRGRQLRIAAECLYLVERSLVRKPYARVLTTKRTYV